MANVLVEVKADRSKTLLVINLCCAIILKKYLLNFKNSPNSSPNTNNICYATATMADHNLNLQFKQSNNNNISIVNENHQNTLMGIHNNGHYINKPESAVNKRLEIANYVVEIFRQALESWDEVGVCLQERNMLREFHDQALRERDAARLLDHRKF